MKKWVLTMAMVVICSVAFAQAWQEKKIQYFVDEATLEFSLNEEQQEQLLKERTEYVSQFSDINKKSKNGQITEEEKKTQVKTINKAFTTYLSGITGKTNKELQPFLKRVREELKSVK
ncbi:hypothetical protein [Labilibacter marinus]|uniref:hypothetical protein n=1 Tax=Labilibacter marinus TaxID=1477105 RepID=UPI00082CC3AB|nr:hypothetical protein [Labilibacter marinus]